LLGEELTKAYERLNTLLHRHDSGKLIAVMVDVRLPVFESQPPLAARACFNFSVDPCNRAINFLDVIPNC
jgi:hypothetical protein